MVIRTYFDRNNTIVYNNTINTGRNPVTELFYGGPQGNETYSRFLFHFDESKLIELNNCGGFGDLTKLKHTLRMTNTGAFDLDLLGKNTCDGKTRACSFDLKLFTIPQQWDEGNGYDYGDCTFTCGGNGSITSPCPSNWIEAQSNTSWVGGNGVYTGLTSGNTIGTQHFEQGNENISIDITDYVNNILSGNGVNFGLGLSYPSILEGTSTNTPHYVGFFTRHTQTFYEPYIETTYDNPIKDDRNNFYLGKLNKLYLYSNIGGEPTTLDNLPTLTIVDPFGNTLSGTTIVTQVACGVYCAEFMIPDNGQYGDCTTFEDTWGNININGVNIPDIEMEFIVKESSNYYNIGDTAGKPKKYGLTVTGINSGERIKRGDIRRVDVTARIPYTINQSQVIDDLQYRLYVKEGNNEYTVIDYQDLNRTSNSNYFLIETSSLIPNIYYIDIRAKSNYEVRTTSDVLKFEIISQTELRDSQ